MNVIHNFTNFHIANFYWFSFANIVLLLKKDGTEYIMEFRPIGLIHAIAKIITKMLATSMSLI